MTGFAFLAMLALGAATAFLLGLAITAAWLVPPRRHRHGFDVLRDDD